MQKESITKSDCIYDERRADGSSEVSPWGKGYGEIFIKIRL